MTGRLKKEVVRPCPACGGGMARGVRPRAIRYKKRSVEIEQPAWWCGSCGEGVLDSKDSVVADRAFATLLGDRPELLARLMPVSNPAKRRPSEEKERGR